MISTEFNKLNGYSIHFKQEEKKQGKALLKKSILIISAMAALLSGAFSYSYFKTDFATLAGDSYRWNELRGQWVVVNYFAAWCAPCLREIPELNKFSLFATKQDNISLFGLSYDPLSDEALAELRDKYQMEFPLITSKNASMPNPRPQSLPATFIISPKGEVVKQLSGEQTNESLQQIITFLEQSKGS
jgi:peroxiredoxin